MSSGSHIQKAFEAMFRQFQPMLVRYAATMLYSREDALEVVQEVFIKIWQKREELEFGDHLKAYLFRAVRNQALNRIQRNKIETVSLDEQLYLMVEDNEASADEHRKQQLASIFREIEQLPPNCREIFLMSRVEGLSHKEIAGILEISTKTVENQIGIALRKIRKGVVQKS